MAKQALNFGTVTRLHAAPAAPRSEMAALPAPLLSRRLKLASAMPIRFTESSLADARELLMRSADPNEPNVTLADVIRHAFETGLHALLRKEGTPDVTNAEGDA